MNRSRYGFTLIELTIVMAIIAILAGIGLSSFTSSQEKGRDAKRRGDLAGISKALDLYYNDYNSYPTGVGGKIVKCGEDGTVSCDWGGGPMQDDRDTVYIQRLPEDPKKNQYVYYYWSDGTSYKLYAYLESLETGITPNETTDCSPDEAVILTCNYGISSANILPWD